MENHVAGVFQLPFILMRRLIAQGLGLEKQHRSNRVFLYMSRAEQKRRVLFNAG